MKNAPENIASQLQEKDHKILQLESILAQMEAVLADKDNLLHQSSVQLYEKDGKINEKEVQISEKDGQIDQMRAKIMTLEWELSSLKRMVFASKSERVIPIVSPSQLELELGLQPVEASQISKQQVSYERQVKTKTEGHKREPLPASLPRETEVIEPEFIPEGARLIREVVTEKLCLDPIHVYVKRIVRRCYSIEKVNATLSDEQITENTRGVIIAPLPYDPFPHFNAHISLIAWVFVSKFVDHLPLYRISKILKREGCFIAESTLNDWFAAICRKLQPLYDYLQTLILQTNYLQADESPIKVLSSQDSKSPLRGYMWVLNDPVRRLNCFQYKPGRGEKHIVDLLKNFSGQLQTDGYKVYDSLADSSQGRIDLMGCMAHARRKFFDAKVSNKALSENAISQFAQLYQIEQQARDLKLTAEQIKELRAEKSVPILNTLHQWLLEQQKIVLPKTPEGKAVGYALQRWDKLSKYPWEGYYQIDNNLIENSIRPLALGRKNYLFAGSNEGAQRIAMAYSFMSFCKVNDLNPIDWLINVAMKIDDLKPSQYNTLLDPDYKTKP